ncbi:MAG: 23S rRNA (adenine(2503)-C(2))-methyltransferase RlmN [Gemmatimonadota bacterium]
MSGSRRTERLARLDPRPEVLDGRVPEVRARIGAWLAAAGQPGYRTDQVVHAIYAERAGSWAAITTLPSALRERLEGAFRFPSIALEEARTSADGTTKFLWRLLDGEAVESVLIPTRSRDTLCLSSQAGCALACSFCATGKLGWRRDLTAGEIVDQARRLLARRGREDPGANVVFMGMGEPLLNWEGLTAALDVLTDPEGLDIGARRITVSTVGVPARIVELGERYPQVRLAVSLHAAIDDVRDGIVPLNRRHPLREVLAACRLWAETTGKRFTFEVVHLPGVNDRPEDVAALAHAARDLPVQINLMRYNPIPGTPYRRPQGRETAAFRDALRREGGVTVTIRRSRGMDVEGACGQLRLAREPAAAGKT